MVGYTLQPLLVRPDWLDGLLTAKFFSACHKHANAKKNERNIYCVDCCLGLCQHCVHLHRCHHLMQVRRYVYHDVVRLQDIQKLVDCSGVQTYIINSARVVFLNQRPQPRPSKGMGNACGTCDRSLQEAYRYCSVCCKVDALGSTGADLAQLLARCNSMPNISCDIRSLSPSILKQIKHNFDDSSGEGLTEVETSEMDEMRAQQSSCSSSLLHIDTFADCRRGHKSSPAPKKIRSSRSCGNFMGSFGAKTVLLSPLSMSQVSLSRRKGIPQRAPVH